MRWTSKVLAVAAIAAVGCGITMPTGIAAAAPGDAAPAAPAVPAAPADPAQLSPGTGWARFGHFSPGTQSVDLYVDGTLEDSNVAFKSVTDYMQVPAGTHEFEIKPTAQPDAPSILSVEAGVANGGSITVGAVSTRDGLAAQVYDDTLTTPPDGASLVRFIHAAPDFPSVNVDIVGGATIATQVAYPAATAYTTIPAGTYDLELRDSTTNAVLATVSAWSISAGGRSTIAFVRGTDNAIDVVPFADAAMTAVTPQGGVQTDMGRSDQPASSHWMAWTLLTAALLAIAGLVVVARVRRLSPVVVER